MARFARDKKILSRKYQEVMLDKRYISQNKVLLDFLLIRQIKIKIKINYQKGLISQLLPLEKLEIIIISKKSIYRTNNIQKVSTLLMEKYTKLLKIVVEISDSIFL